MRKIFLIVILFLGSCSPNQVWLKICSSDEDKIKLSEFVLTCAKNANPLSDEEGEDLVKQCETSGRQIICPTKKMCVDSGYSIQFAHECVSK